MASWGRYVAAGGFLAAAAGLARLSIRRSAPGTRVVFLSVGQGDCTVVQSEGRTALIDVGPAGPRGDLDQAIVLSKLAEWKVDRVDVVLLSHPDLDHVGGLKVVLQKYPLALVMAPASLQLDSKMDTVLANAGAKNVQWVSGIDGVFGKFTVTIRCPNWSGRDDNRASMFVKLADRAASCTTTGDAPQDVEKAMMPIADWRAMLLHMGHHGSRTAGSRIWIEAVHPSIAIVSCGRNNRYGHPHRATVDQLSKLGIPLYRTDEQGDLEFDDVDGSFVFQGRPSSN